jgi:hypothetical protein
MSFELKNGSSEFNSKLKTQNSKLLQFPRRQQGWQRASAQPLPPPSEKHAAADGE